VSNGEPLRSRVSDATGTGRISASTLSSPLLEMGLKKVPNHLRLEWNDTMMVLGQG
jgi:hypothetical protein